MTKKIRHSDYAPNSWVENNTLTGNTFKWQLDDTDGLHILRELESGDHFIKYSSDQIDQMVYYVKQQGRVYLANKVDALRNKTEKDGLGKFIYETFELTETETQTAGHLAALFVRKGLWGWNNKKKGMQFWINDTNWKEKLRDYYNRGLNGVITP